MYLLPSASRAFSAHKIQLSQNKHKTSKEQTQHNATQTMLNIQNQNIPLHNTIEFAKTRPQYPIIIAPFEEKQQLPLGFKPSKYAVICARGNAVKSHPGNIRFTQLVEDSLKNYADASSKLEKSIIVSSIIDSIRRDAPEGAFVKKEKGIWYEVGDHHAREKCGQRLRDLLSSKYASSSAAKKKRRRADETDLLNKLGEVIVTSGHDLPGRIAQLTARNGAEPTDDELQAIFNQANMNLLKNIKAKKLCVEQSDDSFGSLSTTTSPKKKRKFEYSDDGSCSSSSFDPLPFNYDSV